MRRATRSTTTIGADSGVANGTEVPVDTVAENEVLKEKKTGGSKRNEVQAERRVK
jgi:hypothetical protein